LQVFEGLALDAPAVVAKTALKLAKLLPSNVSHATVTSFERAAILEFYSYLHTHRDVFNASQHIDPEVTKTLAEVTKTKLY